MANTRSKTLIRDMTTGSIWRCLLTFGIPYMLSQLLQTAYNLVDMVVVGQFVGSTGLSAVSVGGDVLQLLTNCCMGFATAGQIMIAQYVGKKENENISHTIGTMFTMLLIMGVALGAVCLGLTDTILRWMNTPDEAWSQARAYSQVCYVGLIPVFGYNAVSSVLRGMGDAHRPMIFVGIAAVMNLLLDLLFVAVFRLGAFGAALATVLGQAFSFICSGVFLYRHRRSFGFDFSLGSFVPDRRKLKTLLKLGIPQAIQYSSVAISGLFVNSNLNAYGVTVSAVNGVGSKLTNMMSIVTNAVSAACGSVVGQNLGARKHDRVKKCIRCAIIINACWVIPTMTAVNLFPQSFFRLFTSDQLILDWAPTYMRILLVNLPGHILFGPYYSIASALGYASFNLIVGLLDAFIGRVGLSYLLGTVCGFGIQGFWVGNYCAAYISIIICMIYYYSGRWKTHELLD